LPAPQIFGGYKWFRGDLHLHTFHSDGTWTIPLILDWASASGLDFVGITEHNTFSHHAKIDALAKNYKNLLVLRGEEVTTYGGHFNVWGLPSGKIVDFRVRAKNSPRIKELIADTRKLGAIASINHPFAPCSGCYPISNDAAAQNGACQNVRVIKLVRLDENYQPIVEKIESPPQNIKTGGKSVFAISERKSRE